jgi:hypothetical protein
MAGSTGLGHSCDIMTEAARRMVSSGFLFTKSEPQRARLGKTPSLSDEVLAPYGIYGLKLICRLAWYILFTQVCFQLVLKT